MSGGGSGGGSTNTNTQVQQIPEFEQEFAKANQNIAASLASNPYPTYQGQLIAGFTPQQQQGLQMAGQAATSYQPDLGAAEGLTAAGAHQWSPQMAAQYMSPYAMSALAPQMQQLQLQEGKQQLADDSRATQAGAFGDARHGVQSSLDNFYGNLAMNDLVSQGMNTAYNTGQAAFQNDQGRLLSAGNQFNTLAGQQQGLGETGAQSLFGAGSQQQQLTQTQLTEAYNNFLNQANWGQNQLGLRESALSNSPYNNTNYTSLAPNSSTAQGLGAFSSLAGLLGGGGGTSPKIFGSSSDIRLKREIKRVGETPSGIPVYEYKYIWGDEKNIGCMAHEVEKFFPEAVFTDASGYKVVRYEMVH